MKITSLCMSLVAAAWCFGLPAAQAETKIGYISIAKVFESTTQGKAILQRLQTEHLRKQKELDKRMKDFEAKAKSFQQQAAMLKDEVKQQRLAALAKEEQELKALFMQYQQSINKKKGEALGQFEQQVMGVVQGVAKKEGLDYILRHEVLLHGPSSMDLTNQVIREYDKRHPGKKKKKKKGK